MNLAGYDLFFSNGSLHLIMALKILYCEGTFRAYSVVEIYSLRKVKHHKNFLLDMKGTSLFRLTMIILTVVITVIFFFF